MSTPSETKKKSKSPKKGSKIEPINYVTGITRMLTAENTHPELAELRKKVVFTPGFVKLLDVHTRDVFFPLMAKEANYVCIVRRLDTLQPEHFRLGLALQVADTEYLDECHKFCEARTKQYRHSFPKSERPAKENTVVVIKPKAPSKAKGKKRARQEEEEEVDEEEEEQVVRPPPKKRGRPAKVVAPVVVEVEDEEQAEEEEEEGEEEE